MSEKKLPFHISIGYPGDEVRFQIEDAFSGVQFVEFSMRAETFAAACASRSQQWAEGVVRGLDLLGKKAEHKTVQVDVTSIMSGPTKYHYDRWGEALAPLCKPHEVDGWKARIDRVHNHHRDSRVNGRDLYEVHFDRYVDANPEHVRQVYAEGRARDDRKGSLLRDIREQLRKGKITREQMKSLVELINVEIGSGE